MARTTTSPVLRPTRICTSTPCVRRTSAAIAPHGLLHGQGGIAGPHGMVLMGQGRAKQGHNAVAHDLVDGALIAMYRRHHAFQDRVEELPGLLRVTLGQQFHGALEVGKQHGDLFALAFQGTAGRENLLGEIETACR